MFCRLSSRRVQNTFTTSSIWRTRFLTPRHISSSSHQEEVVSIPVGGNGFVDIQIARPTRPTNHNNILVYLSPGPFPHPSAPKSGLLDAAILRAAFPSTTIVDLKYRLSPRAAQPPKHGQRDVDIDHRFPTPIHDVFAAWDYITDDLTLHNCEIVDEKEVYYRPKVCIYGSHIGGALALSLALTNPNVITAVAVQDVIGDWTGIDEVARDNRRIEQEVRTGKKGSRSSQRSARREATRKAAIDLIRLREKLFRTPSGYFDAFASPTLFLRAPGRDTPVEKMKYGEGVEEVTSQVFGHYDDDWHSHDYEGDQNTTVDRPDEIAKNAPIMDGTRGAHGLSDIPGLDTDAEVDASSSVSSLPMNEVYDQISPGSQSQSLQLAMDVSSSSESPPRRRKVLRRWPPNAQPKEALLPYINIFLSRADIPQVSIPPALEPMPTDGQVHRVDIGPVLRLQALELQDLLRRACFWGREKSFAEERVTLTALGTEQVMHETDVQTEESGFANENDQEKIIKWLSMRFGDAQTETQIEKDRQGVDDGSGEAALHPVRV